MACALYCCGVRSVALGDRFTEEALDYVKKTVKRTLFNQSATLVIGLIAVFNYGLMGLAIKQGASDLAAVAGAVAATHSMVAGAFLSGDLQLHTAVILVPLTALGGIAEGIVFATNANWQSIDPLEQFFPVLTTATFAVTALWLAAISAGIGYGINTAGGLPLRQADAGRRAAAGARTPEHEPLIEVVAGRQGSVQMPRL